MKSRSTIFMVIVFICVIFIGLTFLNRFRVSDVLSSLDTSFEKLSVKVDKYDIDKPSEFTTESFEITNKDTIKETLKYLSEFKVKKSFAKKRIVDGKTIYDLYFSSNKSPDKVYISVIGETYIGISMGDEEKKIYQLVNDRIDLEYLKSIVKEWFLGSLKNNQVKFRKHYGFSSIVFLNVLNHML